MKKKVQFFVVLLVFLIVLGQLVLADYEDTRQKGYDCLLKSVEGTKCSSVSDIEDQIFSYWATQQCYSQVMAKSSNSGEYWGASGTKTSLEITAKALIGLKQAGEDITKPSNYLLQKNTTPDFIDWYIQIEAYTQANCQIQYSGYTYTFDLEEDKTITNTHPAGSCLTPYGFGNSEDKYWFKITDNNLCKSNAYTISCASNTIDTSLIYRKQNPSTSDPYYISVNTHHAGAGATTTEQINSLCFKEGSSCNLEGSLWAAVALDYAGKDITSFLPYLIANTPLDNSAIDKSKYLPEAFIYFIKHYPEFRTRLVERQTNGKWADGSRGEYYDTALALLMLSGDDAQARADSLSWLNSSQKSNGCWGSSAQGDIGDTAFLLFSVWPTSQYSPECNLDTDCGDDEECIYGQCAPEGSECVEDRQCPISGGNQNKVVCIDYMCEECRYADDCSNENLVCTSNHTCDECQYDSDCAELKGEGWGCDIDNFVCERLPDCDADNPCDSGYQCIDGYCMGGYPECSQNSDCTTEPDTYCDNDTCVECIISSNCDLGYVCVNGNCVDEGDECDSDNPCPSGETCSSDNICVPNEGLDCEDSGYFCRSRYSCLDDGGDVTGLTSYYCSGVDWCCDVPSEEKTCSELNGDICSISEDCDGGQLDSSASDLDIGEICCVDGSCVPASVRNDCTFYNPTGICKPSCDDVGETSTTDSCPIASQLCCTSSGSSSSSSTSSGGGGGIGSWVWITIFAVLIILVIIGIVFRDKLSVWFMQFKSKFGGGAPPSQRRPGFPPPGMGPPMMRRPPMSGPPRPRSILPPGANRPPGPRGPPPGAQNRPAPSAKKQPPKPSGELEDVLKKLKDMGK